MPRPPVIEQLNWQEIFESGVGFDAWCSGAEEEKNIDAIRAGIEKLIVPPNCTEKVSGIKKQVNVVAFAEDWCGDVIRHVPVLERLVELNNLVGTRYLARLDAPSVFSRFLTNGGEAIPKFIFLNSDFTEYGNWGPMPAHCRELIAKGKAKNDVATARKEVSRQYAEDSECAVAFAEISELLVRGGSGD
jgi:thiol-disulfide isomerase/thioredoxin